MSRRYRERDLNKSQIMQLLDGNNPKTLVIEAGYKYTRIDNSGRGIVAALVGIGTLDFFDKAAEAAHNDSKNKSFGEVKVALVPGEFYGVERVAEALAAVPGLTLEVYPDFTVETGSVSAEQQLQNAS